MWKVSFPYPTATHHRNGEGETRNVGVGQMLRLRRKAHKMRGFIDA